MVSVVPSRVANPIVPCWPGIIAAENDHVAARNAGQISIDRGNAGRLTRRPLRWLPPHTGAGLDVDPGVVGGEPRHGKRARNGQRGRQRERRRARHAVAMRDADLVGGAGDRAGRGRARAGARDKTGRGQGRQRREIGVMGLDVGADGETGMGPKRRRVGKCQVPRPKPVVASAAIAVRSGSLADRRRHGRGRPPPRR